MLSAARDRIPHGAIIMADPATPKDVGRAVATVAAGELPFTTGAAI
jgi:hypothetical protein